MKNSISNYLAHRYVRLALVVLAIGGCVFAIRTAVVFGLSRVLVAFALVTGNATAANKAVELTPKDAEAHMASAGVLSLASAPEKSLVELENAVALRPADYRLWSEIGLVRDQIGDPAGAIRAFDEAVARAPYYSHPRWNRGNVLLRNKQYEAAFKDLNQAAQSNPELVPGLLDLAWGISRGDVALTEQLVEFRNDKMRIAFARLLARQGRAAEAAAQLGQSASATDATKAELVDQLITKGAYKEAFDVWKTFHGSTGNAQASGPVIYDGGFEGPLSLGEGGFGWRVPRDLQATSVSPDPDRPHSGATSLRIDLNGLANSGWLSQLIIVEPSKRYRINFASRSRDVVSGGLPFLLVSDAGADAKPLGKSAPLAKGDSAWQNYSVEFTTTEKTTAVLLSVQRESCTTSPCPIFGSISLDSFSIELLR